MASVTLHQWFPPRRVDATSRGDAGTRRNLADMCPSFQTKIAYNRINFFAGDVAIDYLLANVSGDYVSHCLGILLSVNRNTLEQIISEVSSSHTSW